MWDTRMRIDKLGVVRRLSLLVVVVVVVVSVRLVSVDPPMMRNLCRMVLLKVE